VITSVLIAAQYVSGNLKRLATSMEVTAATAVRNACKKIGHQVHALHPVRPFAIF
jgi:hypothetical protein